MDHTSLCHSLPCTKALVPLLWSCPVIGRGLLEDGKLAHTGVPTASATAGMLNAEKRSNCGSQCANPMVHSMGTTAQRQNGFRTTESKWDTQKTSTQEVAINVTKGIRQSDRRKTKN
ncbi:hypothetical protein EK904_011864, partial [Melospiza melodia maxima]